MPQEQIGEILGISQPAVSKTIKAANWKAIEKFLKRYEQIIEKNMELLNSIFLPLLAGHLVADFWLQPNSWVLQKKQKGIKSRKLLFACAIASMLPVVFTFQLNLWWFVPIIFVTHILIDFFKSKLKDNIASFLVRSIVACFVFWVLAIYGTKMKFLSTLSCFGFMHPDLF